MAMIRTQIYFDKELYADLKTGAALNNTTISNYIRQLLVLNKEQPTHKPLKSLLDFAKSAKSLGKSNITKNFDKYLPKNLR
jgi:hypothetical protein